MKNFLSYRTYALLLCGINFVVHGDMQTVSLSDWQGRYKNFQIKKEEFSAAIERVKNISRENLQKAAEWIGNGADEVKHVGEFYPFVQRLVLKPGDTLVIFGDIHGDEDAFMNALSSLQKRAILDSDWKIKNGYHFVFLGDYVDRGAYDVEVWYTLYNLRLQNPSADTLVLLRGNHEDFEINQQYGYLANLKKIGVSDVDEQKKMTTSLYDLLPVALYVGVNNNYVMFVHGGLELGFKPEQLLKDKDVRKRFMPVGAIKRAEYKEELSSGLDFFNIQEFDQVIREPGDLQFTWNDFAECSGMAASLSQRGVGWVLCKPLVKELLKRDSIRGVFRGHQHDRSYQSFSDGLVHTIMSATNIGRQKDICKKYSFMMLKTAADFSNWKAFHNVDDKEQPIKLSDEIEVTPALVGYTPPTQPLSQGLDSAPTHSPIPPRSDSAVPTPSQVASSESVSGSEHEDLTSKIIAEVKAREKKLPRARPEKVEKTIQQLKVVVDSIPEMTDLPQDAQIPVEVIALCREFLHFSKLDDLELYVLRFNAVKDGKIKRIVGKVVRGLLLEAIGNAQRH